MDDTKLYLAIKSVRDGSKLQSFITFFENLCTDYDLFLNLDKCKIMSFCRNKCPILFDYEIDGVSIKRVICHMDLGVTFYNKLTFQPHINKVVTGSWKMLGFVTRPSRNLHTTKAMKSIYYSLVRSRLEYASIVWSPIYDVYYNKIDKIQKKFLKFLSWRIDGVYPDPGSDYVNLCRKFRVLSLGDRRLCASAMFVARLVQGYIDCSRLRSLIMFKMPVLRRGPPFHLPIANTNFATSAPTYRVMDAFNKLYNSNNNLDVWLIHNINAWRRL
ncbi:uncharacterized protein LOC123259022, partial [Cotesia glomerata]|uniref:uncharacterized protein LOC123259022 n=1 Tax=Cotesia glomerata TaxID=32391 RepID=UPI001D0270F3